MHQFILSSLRRKKPKHNIKYYSKQNALIHCLLEDFEKDKNLEQKVITKQKFFCSSTWEEKMAPFICPNKRKI
jgi:hypothetical protein